MDYHKTTTKLRQIDSLSTFIHHKNPHNFCFVGLKG